jgi:hypothetical protein
MNKSKSGKSKIKKQYHDQELFGSAVTGLVVALRVEGTGARAARAR